MKRIALLTLTTFLFVSCSLLNSEDSEKEFSVNINNDTFTGTSFIKFLEPERILLKGVEDGDESNGRTLSIIIDNFKGEGKYTVSDYSYLRVFGGDAIINIGTASEPNGTVEIESLGEKRFKAEFSGSFINRDSSETFTGEASFNSEVREDN